jgi:NitT/TauT family transport system ATP-binding protein
LSGDLVRLTLETNWPRDRDSRIVSEPAFGQFTSQLWTLLRDESRKALNAR